MITRNTPAGTRPRDSTELGEILAYRMREHLGALVDYTATLLPNRLAIQVVMIQPEYLRGFTFTFSGGELPTNIRSMRNGVVDTGLVPPNVNLEVNAIHEEINRVTAGLPAARDAAHAQFTYNDMTLTEAEARWPRVRVVRTDAGDEAAVPTAPLPTTINDIQRAYYPAWAAAADAVAYGTGMLRTTGGNMATVTNPAGNATIVGAAFTPAITVRSPEQEVRLAQLEVMYTTVQMTNAQIDERNVLLRMAACPTPVPSVPPAPRPAPRVRVRVWRDDYNQWQVGVAVGGNNRDLPSVAVVKSLLPPADKHFLPSRVGRHRSTLYALRTALEGGLSAQSLHDALRAWVVAAEGAATNVQSDSPILDESTAALLNAMPATLEVGGKVYRLVPTKELDARPLIKRVRERALNLARVEGEGIRTRARTDARVVVSEAEARASTLRMEVERERAAIGNRAPEWVVNSGRPHQYMDGYWYVEIKVLCRVREIRYTVSSWNRVLYWTPLNGDKPNSYYETWRMPVWVRLRPDGHYTKDDISCRGFCSTHIESYMCMELQGLPPTIQSAAHLTTLEGIVSRGMQVINLNSPLNTNPKKYWPAFLEQIPPVPLKLLTSGERTDRYIIPNGRTIERWQAENPSIVWDRSELIEQEVATIFRVPEVGNATT